MLTPSAAPRWSAPANVWSPRGNRGSNRAPCWWWNPLKPMVHLTKESWFLRAWPIQKPGYIVDICCWLVVWNIFYFPIYWECHHPNWLSYFSEGWPNHQPAGYIVDICWNALLFIGTWWLFHDCMGVILTLESMGEVSFSTSVKGHTAEFLVEDSYPDDSLWLATGKCYKPIYQLQIYKISINISKQYWAALKDYATVAWCSPNYDTIYLWYICICIYIYTYFFVITFWIHNFVFDV